MFKIFLVGIAIILVIGTIILISADILKSSSNTPTKTFGEGSLNQVCKEFARIKGFSNYTTENPDVCRVCETVLGFSVCVDYKVSVS